MLLQESLTALETPLCSPSSARSTPVPGHHGSVFCLPFGFPRMSCTWNPTPWSPFHWLLSPSKVQVRFLLVLPWLDSTFFLITVYRSTTVYPFDFEAHLGRFSSLALGKKTAVGLFVAVTFSLLWKITWCRRWSWWEACAWLRREPPGRLPEGGAISHHHR